MDVGLGELATFVVIFYVKLVMGILKLVALLWIIMILVKMVLFCLGIGLSVVELNVHHVTAPRTSCVGDAQAITFY
jgi:ABC-type polysaccharide/polyol phosphate export permease